LVTIAFQKLQESDETFVTSSRLTLLEQPSKPVIYDAQGREVTGVGGPFLEGYNLALICQVAGGKVSSS